jgi:hypothetical protein
MGTLPHLIDESLGNFYASARSHFCHSLNSHVIHFESPSLYIRNENLLETIPYWYQQNTVH